MKATKIDKGAFLELSAALAREGEARYRGCRIECIFGARRNLLRTHCGKRRAGGAPDGRLWRAALKRLMRDIDAHLTKKRIFEEAQAMGARLSSGARLVASDLMESLGLPRNGRMSDYSADDLRAVQRVIIDFIGT